MIWLICDSLVHICSSSYQCWAPQVSVLSPQILNRISIFLIRNLKFAIARLKA